MPKRPAQRASDGRLKANRPPERQARVKPVEEKSRWQKLLDGDITVADLDDEEIMAGRCKDKNGRLAGRPPKNIPRQIHDEMRRRFHEEIQQIWREGAGIAQATLLDVMQSRRAAAPARVRAAEVWMERVQGKVPDKVEQEIVVRKFEEGIEGLLVDVDETNGDTNVVPITSKARRLA